MIGIDEFTKIFGNITVLNVIEIALAAAFIVWIYKKLKAHFTMLHENETKRINEDKERDKKINTLLEEVGKYPQYRQQSINIQNKLENEMAALRNTITTTTNKLAQMEEDTKRRERNKARDRLIQNYRYYTSLENNPSQSWTEMESEAFWECFEDYEKDGGNGYLHTVVQPEMRKLKVIKLK